MYTKELKFNSQPITNKEQYWRKRALFYEYKAKKFYNNLVVFYLMGIITGIIIMKLI